MNPISPSSPKHRLMVIIAGYDDEIDRFLASNEGVGSRVPRRIPVRVLHAD